MGVERMTCCGALTRVYSDAGARVHDPGCKHYVSVDYGKPVVSEDFSINDYIIPDPWKARVRRRLNRMFVCSVRGHKKFRSYSGVLKPCDRCDK